MQHGTRLFEGLEEECRRLGLELQDGKIAWGPLLEMSEDQKDFMGEWELINDAELSLEVLDAGLAVTDATPSKRQLPGNPGAIIGDMERPDLKELLGMPEAPKPIVGLRRI